MAWNRFRMGNGKHNFRSDIPFGNFGLPFKTFRLFWKISVRANQNSLTIYIPPKISGNFSVNGKQLWSTFRGTPLFPFRTERQKCPYNLLNFPVSSLLSAESNYGKLKMVSAISFGWFADFWKNPYHDSTVVSTGLF